MNSVAISVISFGLLSCPAWLAGADKTLSLLDAEARGIGKTNVHAAADWFLDLRISGGQQPYPNRFNFDYTESTGFVDKGHLRSDPGKHLEIYQIDLVSQMYPRGGHFGLVMGIGCFAENVRTGEDMAGIHGYSGGAEARLGVAVRLNPHVHFELAPFYGAGRTKVTDEGRNIDGSDAPGFGRLITYGVGASGFYTTDNGFQVGATVGQVTNDSRFTLHYNSDRLGTPGSSATERFFGTVHGLFATVGIGVRF